jgi:hypothetical protein
MFSQLYQKYVSELTTWPEGYDKQDFIGKRILLVNQFHRETGIDIPEELTEAQNKEIKRRQDQHILIAFLKDLPTDLTDSEKYNEYVRWMHETYPPHICKTKQMYFLDFRQFIKNPKADPLL